MVAPVSPLDGELVKQPDHRQYQFYCKSSHSMVECGDASIALTITSPPYWNAIDYDLHAGNGKAVWYRQREYNAFGETLADYYANIKQVFAEVMRATMPGGFCAIVVGTILHNKRHYPVPMQIACLMLDIGWEFHQDIIWNKVTGGVRRAGSFIQHRRAGYYYPNIMTEYILIFRKPGDIRRGQADALAIDEVFTRDIANNVWHIAPVPPNQLDHPCPYPEELVRRLVLLYSDKGDAILDPFLGSGQTALVALREGRTCVGYDVEQKYIDLAHARMQAPQHKRKFNLVARFDKVEMA